MAAQSPVLRLEVYVQPRASSSEVAGWHDGVPRIRLRAPAVDDAANEALVEFIATRLGLPRRAVRIAAGRRSRRKRLEIAGVTAEALQRLFQPD